MSTVPHRQEAQCDRGQSSVDFTEANDAMPVGNRVLIVTGSAVVPDTERKGAARETFKRQVEIFKSSSGGWLDVNNKLEMSELVLLEKLERRSRRFKKSSHRDVIERFFSTTSSFGVPELAEVSLATLLRSEGIELEAVTFARLVADHAHRDKLLSECGCVFLSTTFIRDLAELEVMAGLVKRPNNRVVAGGALAGLIHARWQGSPGVDVLAVGYGEYLVPSLAAWIRTGYQTLEAPPTGRLISDDDRVILYSGVPSGKNLDDLPSPDWSIARDYHGRQFGMVLYESVRGCPYRCAFCNYPFLFDDTKFRMRSAEKIAEDWARLAEQGFKNITCLDSLFTMPKRRVIKLCQLLIERNIRVNWVCFARADDLTDLETCEWMKRAGCVKVLIGLESGSQVILDNMNKRCSVEANAAAIHNCREVGITTSASIIVGFPGDDEEKLTETFEFLKANPPDLFNIYTFCVRSDNLPILSPANRARFGLETADDGRSAQPYWTHDSMSSADVIDHAHELRRRLMQERVALDGTVFYANTLDWDPGDREALLDFQRDLVTRHQGFRWLWRLMRWVTGQMLKRAVRKTFPTAKRDGVPMLEVVAS